MRDSIKKGWRAEQAPAADSLDTAFYLSALPQLGFRFYGRRREYRQIRDGFTLRNYRAVIIWGVGGIGKTALVSHVADRLYHRRKIFSGVYAFDCRGGALSVERILLDLHRYLSLQGISSLEPYMHQSLSPEITANLVGQLLSQWPMLMIFDNFEDLLERIEDRLCIRDENLRTFITTLVKATPSGSKFLFTTRHLFDLGDGRLGDILALPLKVSGAQLALVSHNLAIWLAERGDYVNALRRYEQSLQIKKELGDRAGMAKSLLNIGTVHQARGEYDEALRLYEESLPIFEELGDRLRVANSMHTSA